MLEPSEEVREAFAPILMAIAEHASAVATTADLVAIRPGYRNNDPARPAIVLAFRPPQPAHAAGVARALAARTGVEVWATEASPEEQSRWIAAAQRPQRDRELERYLRAEAPAERPAWSSYAPPAGAPPLVPVRGTMRATLCASPDAGWPVLSEFLARGAERLVIAMYYFTAPHVYEVLLGALDADPDSELHMVRNPDLGESGAGPNAGDLDGTTVEKRLRRALGERFEFARTSVGKAGVFESAYHIKVAVADSNRLWLSSGNWQSTSLPPFDPIGAPGALPPGYARRYNREYHAVIEHAGPARTLEAYIEHDLAVARDERPAAVEVLDIAVPIEPALPEAVAPARWFPPLEIDRELEVQPVLTPDNYAAVVLALIQRATKSIRFQNQYINLLERDFEAFRELVAALLAKQRAGLDVRIICRDSMEARRIDTLLAAGFDGGRLRFLAGCHNKAIIVDETEVLIGSHNWSNDGTVSNRDASLLFFDAEVARYFGEIYEHDWRRARTKASRRQPRVLRYGEALPAGTARASFGDVFADGRVLPREPDSLEPPP